MDNYLYPATLQEALHYLHTLDGEAQILAGGTDLIPDLRAGKAAPGYLVDITGIPELTGIEINDKHITLGAAVSFSEIKEHPVLREYHPALVQAAGSIGAGAIQQAATWAGNIVQAMPAADGAIIALALEAEARIMDQHHARWVPVGELFLGPGKSAVDPTRELITSIRFPNHNYRDDWGASWQRVGRRQALVLPIINAAVKLKIAAGETPPRVEKVVIAVGPAAPFPFRAGAAESFLRDQQINQTNFRQAGILARDQARPRSSPMRASRRYRLDIIPPLIERALWEACSRAQNSPAAGN